MRITRRDQDGWIRDLSPQEREQLQSLLAGQGAGAAVDTVMAERRRLENIVKRGRIRSEDEYHKILARVEEVFTDPAAADEVHLLNRILAEFGRDMELKLP